MNKLLKPLNKEALRDDRLNELRRALLQSDREESRSKADRQLFQLAMLNDDVISPLAFAGLASSALWSHHFSRSLYWCSCVILRYPRSAAAVWCSRLMSVIYKTLGMAQEHFAAEGKRISLVKSLINHQHAKGEAGPSLDFEQKSETLQNFGRAEVFDFNLCQAMNLLEDVEVSDLDEGVHSEDCLPSDA